MGLVTLRHIAMLFELWELWVLDGIRDQLKPSPNHLGTTEHREEGRVFPGCGTEWAQYQN